MIRAVQPCRHPVASCVLKGVLHAEARSTRKKDWRSPRDRPYLRSSASSADRPSPTLSLRMAFMKAAVCTRYGPPEVLQILVRLVLGMRRPRRSILGLVLAGEIEQAGKRVRRFGVGDRVFAFTMLHGGSYAQYTCLRETKTIALAPSNLSDEEAAAIPYGGLMALHHLRKGNIQNGQQVLIYGASGETGTSAVQLARHFGAEVTAVCSTTNLELVKSLGADTVIDYTTQHSLSAGKLYDLVLDAVGRRKTSALKVACSQALAPGGKYVSVDDE